MPNQKGAIPFLILVAAVGVIGVLVVTSYAPFRNQLLSSLFPKQFSHAASSMPLCPTHDLTKWHSLVDPVRNCHYNHEHKDNPNDPDIVSVLGSVGQYTNGQEISYPWQTYVGAGEGYPPPPTDPAKLENGFKHGFYGWIVRTKMPCVSASDKRNGGEVDGCLTDFRWQEHGDMSAVGAISRFHSYWIEARLCLLANQSKCGLIRTGGWMDTGFLEAPETNYVPLPGDGGNSDPNKRRLHRGYVNNSVTAGAEGTWYGAGGMGFSDGLIGETWGPVNPSNPSQVLFYDGPNGLAPSMKHDANASNISAEYIIFNLAYYFDELDGKNDNLINYKGYTDRYGNVVTNCTKVGLDCVPLELVNVPLGLYKFQDSDDTLRQALTAQGRNPDLVKDYDSAPSDQDWIEHNPQFSLTSPQPTSTPLPSPSASPSPSMIPSPTPSPSAAKPGDLDGNNKVDIFDYNILLGNFGKTGPNLAGDIDKNGKVDIFDFNILLTNFGK